MEACCLVKKNAWGRHSLFLSLLLCLTIPAFLSGCTRLEVCGSSAGQDFPLGLPHSVNTGNSPDLHPCFADVPQLTLMSTNPLTNNPKLLLVFLFVFDYDLLIKLNKTFTLHTVFLLYSLNLQMFTSIKYGLQPVTMTVTVCMHTSAKEWKQ